MSLKTEYGYNEDDFVENQDGMQELTVTITLCEYRNLLKDIAYQDAKVEKLEEEAKKTKETTNALLQMILLKSPEVIDKLYDVISAILPNTEKAEVEKSENDEQIS